MAGWREWFVMTRHERRGALALLVLLMLAVVTLWLVRSRTSALTPAEAQQLQRFEAQVDSMTVRADSAARHLKPKKEKTHKTRKNGKARKPGGKKPSSAPRRLDPVPQY